MIYRTNVKPRKVIYIDIAAVPPKHLEWFLKGVGAAMKAIETSEALKIEEVAHDKQPND